MTKPKKRPFSFIYNDTPELNVQWVKNNEKRLHILILQHM